METKQCTECHEEIPKKVRRCKHCGGKQPRHFWQNPWFYVIILLISPSIFFSSVSTPKSKNGNTSSEYSTVEDVIQLELQSWSWEKGHNYAIAEGEVKNISNETLENVFAVANFYTEDDTFISSDKALIEYHTLLPGQVSPFKIMENYNPLMNNATLSFNTRRGGLISYKKKE